VIINNNHLDHHPIRTPTLPKLTKQTSTLIRPPLPLSLSTLPVNPPIINQAHPNVVEDFVKLPTRVVEGRVIRLHPQSPKDNGAKSHPNKTELIKFTRDPIRENPLLPSERSPRANGIPRS
jgi:hypothetical protein